MEFIKSFLQGVDILWAIYVPIGFLAGGFFLVEFFPIPTLVFLIWMIDFNFKKAGVLSGYPELRASCIFKGTMLIFITIGIFGFFTYLTMKYEMCKDLTDFIPGTLAGLVQYAVPHTCAAYN